MSAKSLSFGDPFRNRLEILQNRFVKFEEVCRDENFAKLVYELNNKGQSTINNSDYLDSLTTKSLLKDICFYGREESTKYNYKSTNKEK